MKRASIVFALALYAGSVAAHGWYEVRTESFTLLGDVPRKQIQRVAVDVERFREAIGRLTHGYVLEVELPTTLYLFESDRDLTPYKRNEQGRTMSVSGYFLPRKFANYMVMDINAGEEPRRVVYHELVHAMLHATFERLPLWLDEGLAEYYASFAYFPATRRIDVGRVMRDHVQTLAVDGLMPFADLFGVTPESPEYNERDRKGRFYAQSWLLVHYLVGEPERREVLNRILSAARERPEEEVDVLAALGCADAELQATLGEYLRASAGTAFTERLEESLPSVSVSVRPLGEPAALLRLTELLAHLGGEDNLRAAEEHLAAARVAGATGTRLRELAGLLAELRGDDATALAQYRRASEAPDARPEFLVRLAYRLLQVAIERSDGTSPPIEVREARALLRRSLAADPNQVDALAAMGKTYLFTPDHAEDGFGFLNRAQRLRPDRVDVPADLACLLSRSGRREAAWSVLRLRIRPRFVDPETVAYAERCLAEAEMDAMEQSLRAGDRDAAVTHLRVIRERGLDAALGAAIDVDALIGHVRAGDTIVRTEGSSDVVLGLVERANAVGRLVEEGELEHAEDAMRRLVEECASTRGCTFRRDLEERLRLIRENRRIDRYNAVIADLREGRTERAVERLRTLQRETGDPELASRIRETLAQLETVSP